MSWMPAAPSRGELPEPGGVAGRGALVVVGPVEVGVAVARCDDGGVSVVGASVVAWTAASAGAAAPPAPAPPPGPPSCTPPDLVAPAAAATTTVPTITA